MLADERTVAFLERNLLVGELRSNEPALSVTSI
jgi:hypothetical protein